MTKSNRRRSSAATLGLWCSPAIAAAQHDPPAQSPHGRLGSMPAQEWLARCRLRRCRSQARFPGRPFRQTMTIKVDACGRSSLEAGRRSLASEAQFAGGAAPAGRRKTRVGARHTASLVGAGAGPTTGAPLQGSLWRTTGQIPRGQFNWHAQGEESEGGLSPHQTSAPSSLMLGGAGPLWAL